MVLGKFTIIYTLAFLQRRCFLNYHGLIRLSSAANVSFTVSITVLFFSCQRLFSKILCLFNNKSYQIVQDLDFNQVTHYHAR